MLNSITNLHISGGSNHCDACNPGNGCNRKFHSTIFWQEDSGRSSQKRIASLLAVHNFLSHAAGQKGDSRTEDQYGVVLDCQVCVGTALKDTLVLYTGEYCPFYPAGVPSANEWKDL